MFSELVSAVMSMSLVQKQLQEQFMVTVTVLGDGQYAPRFSIQSFAICGCMEALSRVFRVALPWELLYADDLFVIAETEDDLIKSLNEWKDFAENREA